MKGIYKTLIPNAGSSMLLIAMKRMGFLVIEMVEMRFSFLIAIIVLGTNEGEWLADVVLEG